MSFNQAAGYHGIENAKFAKRIDGVRGTTITDIPYAKNINLNNLLDNAEAFANNLMVLQVPQDKGYDGQLGTTAILESLEEAIGSLVNGADGKMKAQLKSYERFDLYYEFTMTFEDGEKKYKVWVLNITIGKANENHSTDENAINFGEYAYPIRVFGDTIQKSDGSGDYIDDNGMTKKAFMVISKPTDTGYANFEDAVALAKMAVASI